MRTLPTPSTANDHKRCSGLGMHNNVSMISNNKKNAKKTHKHALQCGAVHQIDDGAAPAGRSIACTANTALQNKPTCSAIAFFESVHTCARAAVS